MTTRDPLVHTVCGKSPLVGSLVKHLALDTSQATVFYEISWMLTEGHDQQVICNAIVVAARQFTDAFAATLALIDENGDLVVIARSPDTARDAMESSPTVSEVASQAINERRSILIPRVLDGPVGVAPDGDSKMSTGTYLAVPLIWRTKALGVLTVSCGSPTAIGPELLAVIDALARHAAATVVAFRDKADELRLQAEAAEIARQFAEQAIDLERIQEQLIQTEKFAAVAELAHRLAHEMNTPLGIVISNLTVFEQYSETLCAIVRAAQDLLPHLLADERTVGPAKPLADAFHDADVSYTLDDLPDLIADSRVAAQRAADLVRSMGTFARREASVPNTPAI